MNKTKLIWAIFLIFITTILTLIYNKKEDNVFIPVPEFRQEGPKNAKIKIYEYTDFACPACAYSYFKIQELLLVYKDKIQVNFKYYPLLSIHPFSLDASLYAECAGKQGKFLEYANLLFKNRESWVSNENYILIFKDYAKKLNLNEKELNICIKDKNTLLEIEKDIKEGENKNIDATPTFFINSKRAIGFGQLIDEFKILTSKDL